MDALLYAGRSYLIAEETKNLLTSYVEILVRNAQSAWIDIPCHAPLQPDASVTLFVGPGVPLAFEPDPRELADPVDVTDAISRIRGAISGLLDVELEREEREGEAFRQRQAGAETPVVRRERGRRAAEAGVPGQAVPEPLRKARTPEPEG